MNRWIARLLALVLAAAAVYLVYANVHAVTVLLEATLGAAVLTIATLFVFWNRPQAALVLNVLWIAGAFGLTAWLTHGHVLPNVSATTQGPQSVALTSAPVSGSAEKSMQDSAVRIDDVLKSANPEDYVLEARAAKLPTIDAAFAYVKDNIGFESYSGILRGGRGAFYDRSGNALDRSMLLAAILQINKVPVRIATGQLTTAQAERLYARIFETAPSPQPSSQPGGVIQRIFDRGHRDYDTMMSALGNAPPAVNAPSHDEVIKEIAQHAWVQAQRNGQWIDLDTAFPDAVVGKAYTAAAQTYDSPPAQLMQQVTIRVIAERLLNGAVVKDTVLETTMPANQLIDKQVYLVNKPYQPFNGQGGQLQYVFGNKDVFEPMLIVGAAPTVGKPIDFGSGASASGTSAPNSVQAAANAFGTPSTGPASSNANAFVAEWLEFEVGTPDGRKDVARRALVDRAGTAWRRNPKHDSSTLRDLVRGSNNVLLEPQTVYNVWLSGGKHNALAYGLQVDRLAHGGLPYADPKAPTMLEQLWPFAMRNFAWFVASDHIIVPAINDTQGLRLYADSPRIFVWSVGPDPTGKTKEVVVESDLRRDVLRAVVKDPSSQSAIASHKVLFGALEGAMENELGAPPQPDASTEYVTTSSLADSGGVTLLAPGSSVSATDPETQARLQSVVASGNTAIVPKRALNGGMAGWWQIAPGTGDVRPVLDDDLDGGFTKGGFPKNPLPGPGDSPKGNPINWNGPQRDYFVRLETEFDRETKLLAKGIDVGEFGEDKDSSGQVIVESEPAWLKVAVATGEGSIFALWAWEILKGAL